MARLALFGGSPVVTLPSSAPQSGEEELQALKVATDGISEADWRACLMGGGPIRALEQTVADRLGVSFALALASGTVALEVALRACQVGFGDEVILSPYDWGAAAGAVLRLGAIPVFGDIEPRSYTLDPASVLACLTRRTKAIVVTHIFGHPAEMEELSAIAHRSGCVLIEDGAQALGSSYRGRPVGALGRAACFSLGWGKVISGGEGGLLVTDDEGLYERAVFWSQHPFGQLARTGSVGPWGELAGNGRIHPVAAAIALQHLGDLERRLAERRANCARLSRGLEGVPGIRPVAARADVDHAYHRYSPTFVPEEVEGISRDVYVSALAAEGVPIGAGFIERPLHLHPVFRRRSYGGKGWPWRQAGSTRHYRPGTCPVAEARCFDVGLGIGSQWDGVPSAWIDEVLTAFRKVTERVDDLRAASRSSEYRLPEPEEKILCDLASC